MEHFDVVIIGLGPTGAVLARQLSGKIRVIALDKKCRCGNEGFTKPCGGLLAPDTRRSFIRDGITLLVNAIANPQVFNIKTADVAASLACNCQHNYTSINRHAFDLWPKSLIPDGVQVYHDSLCRKVWHEGDKWHVILCVDGWGQQITTRYLMGADGASSLVRRHLYPQHQVRKHVAIQQWLMEKYPVPFYSCTFDSDATDYYSWSISKDDYFIFGSTYPMKNGQARFDALEEKSEAFRFQFGRPVKNEEYTVLFPSRWKDLVYGEDNTFLIDGAADFISTSSLEGINYALNSAEILKSVLLRDTPDMNHAYREATHRLCPELCGKILKSRALTSAFSRK